LIKLFFALLPVSLTMGLTRCYKREFLYIYICIFVIFYAICIYLQFRFWPTEYM